MAQSNNEGMEVLDVAVVQGGLSRFIYQGDARRNNDEHGKELIGFLDTVVQVVGQHVGIDLCGALNIGQGVGRHVQWRSVADKTTLGLAPHLDGSRQDFLLNGQSGFERHRLGGV